MKKILAVAVVLLMAVSAQAAPVLYTDALNINLTGSTYGSGESVGLPKASTNQVPTNGFNSNWSQLRITSENSASIDTFTNSYWRIYTAPSTISALSPANTIQTSTGTNVSIASSAGFHIQGAQTIGGAIRWGEQSSSPYGSHANDRGLLNGATLTNSASGDVTLTFVNVPFPSYEVWGFLGTSTQMGNAGDWSWVKMSGANPVSGDSSSTWTLVGSTRYNGLAAIQILAIPEPATMSLLVLGGIATLLKRRNRR